MPEPESVLVARCRAGEPAAWDELFDRHYDAVGRFLFQADPELTAADLEDLCQEVFLAAIRNLDKFGGRSALQTWLFRIAVNKARDWREKCRAAKRGGGRVPVSIEDPGPEARGPLEVADAAAGPDLALDQAERAAWLHAALERLGDPCRELIELRYFADLSYAELAQEYGTGVKAIGSRLHQCLGRLAALAGRPGGEDSV